MITVKDVAGRAIITRPVVKTSNEVSLDLSSYQNGTYFVTVDADGQTTTQKVVLTK
jgi:hypothetical protein